jgi:hypothetical protein
MRELVPIKVKIGLKNNGQALYPDFNNMNCIKNSGLDWSKYVDIKGLGWHYDKKCGHKEEDSTSPYGMQHGVLVVDKEFADEAVGRFPGEVEKLTEVKLKEFYDDRAHCHEQDEEIDVNVLQGIKMKQDMGLDLTPQQLKALDPDDETRGIRKNKKKKWDDFKKLKGIKIVQ